jgi:3-carboxy-cis,cis-muconate cycloisomerase
VTFDGILVPDDLREAVGDAAWIEAMLQAEAALARAEAAAAVIPREAAEAISRACGALGFRPDPGELAAQGRATANPAEPLVRALRERVGGEAAGFVHWGATSQDILDSAAMLVTARGLDLIGGWLDAAAARCAVLAAEHRTTALAGRTLLQQAVPTTFGLTAAGWLLGLRDARELVAGVRARGLYAQLGGAVGSLEALGERAADVLRLYAHELGLACPPAPWHTRRIALIRIGAALAAAAAAAGKVATDVVLLSQTEVSEVRERAGGGSTTMPHKRNSAASVRARACAVHAGRHAAALVAGGPHELERAAGAWHAEWDALSGALRFTGAATAVIAEMLAGLEVDAGRMRRNLDLTGGLVMAERVTYLAAARIGLPAARRLVEAAAARASAEGVAFRQALGDTQGLPLRVEEIDAALDPAAGLGSAAALVDRILEGEVGT